MRIKLIYFTFEILTYTANFIHMFRYFYSYNMISIYNIFFHDDCFCYHVQTQLIFCLSKETLLINMFLLIPAKLFFFYTTPTIYGLCIPIYLGFFFPILWTTKVRKQCTMLEIEDSLSDKLYSQIYPYVGHSYSYDIISTYNIFMIIILIIRFRQLIFSSSTRNFIN